jgi:hypothetical protein
MPKLLSDEEISLAPSSPGPALSSLLPSAPTILRLSSPAAKKRKLADPASSSESESESDSGLSSLSLLLGENEDNEEDDEEEAAAGPAAPKKDTAKTAAKSVPSV